MRLNPYALRCWRRERKLSISQLAAAVPMPQPNLSKMEKGTEQPSAARLRRIAEVLGIDVEALVGPDTTIDLNSWPHRQGGIRRVGV